MGWPTEPRDLWQIHEAVLKPDGGQAITGVFAVSEVGWSSPPSVAGPFPPTSTSWSIPARTWEMVYVIDPSGVLRAYGTPAVEWLRTQVAASIQAR